MSLSWWQHHKHCRGIIINITITIIFSAGVGRTGTFIVIDSMLERIKHVDTVDIYGHVTCLRAQRNYMVQTEDQYVFIHDAVLEAITSGNTEILARNLSTHVRQLLQPLSDHRNALQLEFQVPRHCQWVSKWVSK